jgi:hypothetical protein
MSTHTIREYDVDVVPAQRTHGTQLQREPRSQTRKSGTTGGAKLTGFIQRFVGQARPPRGATPSLEVADSNASTSSAWFLNALAAHVAR